jgi:hypothetical protein
MRVIFGEPGCSPDNPENPFGITTVSFVSLVAVEFISLSQRACFSMGMGDEISCLGNWEAPAEPVCSRLFCGPGGEELTIPGLDLVLKEYDLIVEFEGFRKRLVGMVYVVVLGSIPTFENSSEGCSSNDPLAIAVANHLKMKSLLASKAATVIPISSSSFRMVRQISRSSKESESRV